jgi:hypothetical protein
LRDLHDLSGTRHRSGKRALLVQPQMGTGSVVVSEIRSERPLEMPGVENHEMVQAISPYRADQALDVRILPRALRRCEDFLHLQRRDPQTNIVAVDSIPIANDVSWRIPLGKSFDDLLGRSRLPWDAQ